MKCGDQLTIEKPALDSLIAALRARDYRTIGPTMGDGAIIYDDIAGVHDLPVGWIDEQDAGHYRIKPGREGRHFDYVVGPHSWKKYLFPPKLTLLEVSKTDAGITSRAPDLESPKQKMAFIGVRACELAAIDIQDTIFLRGPFVDPHYKIRRSDIVLIAVNCVRPGGTCFCASMNTGPRARAGYDLALTELEDHFLVEIGSELGTELMRSVPHTRAANEEIHSADAALATARTKMGRELDATDLPELLLNNLDHPQWERVAERCLSCTNCTMVCPTCFCSTVEDVNDLRGDHSERVRLWSSCFTMEFTHMHGGGIRPTIKDRYRQWMTHKLATWVEQFGTSGCVGCGRCITWCPPGIDITAEVVSIRGGEKAGVSG